jgi:hypothetical protein
MQRYRCSLSEWRSWLEGEGLRGARIAHIPLSVFHKVGMQSVCEGRVPRVCALVFVFIKRTVPTSRCVVLDGAAVCARSYACVWSMYVCLSPFMAYTMNGCVRERGVFDVVCVRERGTEPAAAPRCPACGGLRAGARCRQDRAL